MKKKIAKYLLSRKWFVSLIQCALPNPTELDDIKESYRASGGDAGWIKDAYKNGYIDGWNKKHLKI